jgi:hypothetical protein
MSALKWIVTGKQLASKRIAQLLPKQKFIKNNIRRLETSTNGPHAQTTPVNIQPRTPLRKFGRAALLYGLVPSTLLTGALLAIPSTREYALSGIDISWRFARSAGTAAIIAYDYKRSLSGKTEERRKIALQEVNLLPITATTLDTHANVLAGTREKCQAIAKSVQETRWYLRQSRSTHVEFDVRLAPAVLSRYARIT